MSSLAKLSIRGVRAFGPDEDEQVVEFFFPFTIIVGQNGCGKTTIIECLKYAITGGLPPGNKSGQAFVHDPRQSGNKQTKASVKLRFNSRNGQPAVVLRSMELTQNKTTLSFKQLDGVIRTAHPETGERVSLSHKCSELDSQLPAMLGISKAILDSVLFCHQEEANWPLQEGAVLKKKFDDIFDSTRYTKALDAFRKKEKELASKCKDIKVDLAGLESTKNAVEGYRRELQEQLDLEEGLSADKDDINKALEREEEKIKYFNEIVEQVDTAGAELATMQHLHNEHLAALGRMQQMVEEDLTETHTLEDLNAMLEDFDNLTSSKKNEEQQLAQKIQDINTKIEAIHRSELETKAQIGKLEAEKDAYERCLKARVHSMEGLASAYKINLQELTQTQQTTSSTPGFGSLTAPSQSVDTVELLEIAPEDMQSFLRMTQKIEGDMRKKLAEYRARSQAKEDEIQERINTQKFDETALDKERESIVKRRRELSDERSQLNKPGTGNLYILRNEHEDAKRNAERLAKERDDANSNPRLKDIDIEMRQIEDKWDELKRKQADLKIELDALQESADAYTAISTLEEELTREYHVLKESVKDCSALLCRFNLTDLAKFPEVTDDGSELTVAVDALDNAVRAKLSEAQEDLDEATRVFKQKDSAVSEKSGKVKGLHGSIQSLSDQFAKLRDGPIAKVRSVVQDMKSVDVELDCDETKPEQLRNYIDKQYRESKLKAGDIDPVLVNVVLQKLLEPLMGCRGDEPVPCPCCEQLLDTPEKKEKVRSICGALASEDSPFLKACKDPKAARLCESYQAWQEIIHKESTNLLDYRRLEKEMKDQQSAIERLEKELEEEKRGLMECKDTMEDRAAVVTDLVELGRATDRWKDASMRIYHKALSIQGKRKDLSLVGSTSSVSTRDRRTVDRLYADVTEEVDCLSNKKTELNAEATKLNQRASQLSQQALNAENRAREKAVKLAELEDAAARKDELAKIIGELDAQKTKVEGELFNLRKAIANDEKEKARHRDEATREEKKMLVEVQEFESSLKHLGMLTHQIDRYANSDKPLELRNLVSVLSDYADQAQACKAELATIQPQLDSLRASVNDQERRKRQLEYNIQIIEEHDSLAKLTEKIRAKEADIKKVKHSDNAYEKLAEANSRKTKLLESKNQSEGRFSEIVERIRALKRKLSQPEYRDVDKKHRNAKVEYETTHMAAEDLKTYQKALDSALLQFHAKKLAEINKIIRELWLMTYKGNDITKIEIQSGQEPGSRAQKSYNYRVVMFKGSTELDMRGRCSAGQRVLACIVIRLALAESFGINCGCIALDEPTVNLDYENKRGLAIALAQIIASRSQQRNFQLILITHDEEFVSMMKTELAALTGFSMPEKYFQVAREAAQDGKFYSKIRPVDWDNL